MSVLAALSAIVSRLEALSPPASAGPGLTPEQAQAITNAGAQAADALARAAAVEQLAGNLVAGLQAASQSADAARSAAQSALDATTQVANLASATQERVNLFTVENESVRATATSALSQAQVVAAAVQVQADRLAQIEAKLAELGQVIGGGSASGPAV